MQVDPPSVVIHLLNYYSGRGANHEVGSGPRSCSLGRRIALTKVTRCGAVVSLRLLVIISDLGRPLFEMLNPKHLSCRHPDPSHRAATSSCGRCLDRLKAMWLSACTEVRGTHAGSSYCSLASLAIHESFGQRLELITSAVQCGEKREWARSMQRLRGYKRVSWGLRRTNKILRAQLVKINC
jgi:hypothetical protein